MAISATAAEDTWFGRHERRFRFGGGIYGGNGGSSIVNIIDGNEVVGVCGSTTNTLARSDSRIRDELNSPSAAASDEYEDEVFCERSSDEEYGRRLLLTALSAAAVVPSRRGDLAFEKWPFCHKKSYLFKPRRRPSLSNVVEIYEHGHDDDKCSAPVSGVNVVENASKANAVASCRDESKSASAKRVDKLCAGSLGGSCCGESSSCKKELQHSKDRKVANDVKSKGAGVSNIILDTSKSSPPRTGRLFGSATDLREQNALKESPAYVANGCTPAAHKARRSSLSKSWYGEATDKLPFNGVPFAADKDGHVWRRRSTFTSVPEDEDAIGEIAVDAEERVVLLERSVSVPNDDALSTPPASRTTKAMSFVDGMRTENGDRLSPSTTSSSSSASKLGKWSRSKIDLLVPSLKSLVTLTANKLSSSRSSNLNCRRNSTCAGNNYSSRIDVRNFGSPLAATLRRNISLNSVSATSNGTRKNASTDSLADVCLLNKKLRKCNTVLTLSGAISKNPNANGNINVEPLRPINRLRVSPGSQDAFPISRMCSRCSSLLSMASSSRYSLNSAHDFVPVLSPGVLCKVCLNEVPLKDSWTLQHCECSYCVDCVRSYVEFEVNQGAYSISCPDAQCEKQGIIMLEEIESLVSLENIEKHKRYRLNKEVEMDKSRTWCPRAGCETVCTLCSTDRCTPQNVHCPTCNMDFCSNCRANWHAESPCKSEEVVPGVTFDSELIKCCPMCSVPIEKDEGCAQMLCKRCKHVFCWYCLASLDDDFLLRHYDKGPCKNKLGHSRASVIWHRTQVISIFAGFGILLLIASPLLLLAAPCIVCCKCRVCTSDAKLDGDDDIADITELQGNADGFVEKEPTSGLESDSS